MSSKSKTPSAVKTTRINSPRSKKSKTPLNLADLIQPNLDSHELKIIHETPIKIKGTIHYLYFLNRADAERMKHKLIGYTKFTIPNDLRLKIKEGYSLVSRKSQVNIDNVEDVFSLLYTKKGKFYIYPGDAGKFL